MPKIYGDPATGEFNYAITLDRKDKKNDRWRAKLFVAAMTTKSQTKKPISREEALEILLALDLQDASKAGSC